VGGQGEKKKALRHQESESDGGTALFPAQRINKNNNTTQEKITTHTSKHYNRAKKGGGKDRGVRRELKRKKKKHKFSQGGV